jgi:hypothetical protein
VLAEQGDLHADEEFDLQGTIRSALICVSSGCGIQRSGSPGGLGDSMSIGCLREGGGTRVVGQGGRKGQRLAERRELLLGIDSRCFVDAVRHDSVSWAC